MNTPTIYVQMLGGFSVTYNDNSINDQSSQSKKPWNILEYLITFRDRDIPSSELIDLIWSEKQGVNPGGALKTLIFRSRKLLEPLGYLPQNLLIQKRGSYSWNPAVKTVVDTDEFEALCTQAAAADDADIQLELYLRALQIYKGDFLPKSSWESWVVPINTYYHSLYRKSARKVIELLSAHDEWEKIIEICRKAITIEPFDEDFHYHLIYALYNNQMQNQALEHYKYTTDLFYNEFAITPSERLKSLYIIISDNEHGITTDLSLIQEGMQEDTRRDGAYYCEFSVFRDIYQLERRAIERTGDSIYLCQLTIRDTNGAFPKPAIMARAMNDMEQAVFSSLRRGDVYARYSVSQYLILLPTISYENGETVMKRIIRNFKKGYARKQLVVDYSLQPVTPDISEEPAYH